MVFLGKRGYFFVIDAIIAATVLLFGLLYLFASGVSSPGYTQTTATTEDIGRIILQAPLARSTNQYYIQHLLRENVVPDPEATALEEIGYLYYVSPAICPTCKSHAYNFSESILDDVLESRYGAAIYIDNVLIYNRTISSTLVAINRSVVVYIRPDANSLVGPLRGDLVVWY